MTGVTLHSRVLHWVVSGQGEGAAFAGWVYVKELGVFVFQGAGCGGSRCKVEGSRYNV